MRLTIRCILHSMRAVEACLDELQTMLRGTAYYTQLVEVKRAYGQCRTSLSNVLDQMIDSGDGE